MSDPTLLHHKIHKVSNFQVFLTDRDSADADPDYGHGGSLATFGPHGIIVSTAWDDLRQARKTDEVLVSLESETVRLQSLIHRYFNQPQAALLADIEARRVDVVVVYKIDRLSRALMD